MPRCIWHLQIWILGRELRLFPCRFILVKLQRLSGSATLCMNLLYYTTHCLTKTPMLPGKMASAQKLHHKHCFLRLLNYFWMGHWLFLYCISSAINSLVIVVSKILTVQFMQLCNSIMKSFLQPLEFQSYTAGSNKCKVEICEVSGVDLAVTS